MKFFRVNVYFYFEMEHLIAYALRRSTKQIAEPLENARMNLHCGERRKKRRNKRYINIRTHRLNAKTHE